MVLNQNIMYGTDALNAMQSDPRRNIMQGGLPKRDLTSLRAEYEQLKKEIETHFQNAEQINNSIRQAGLYQKPSDQQVLETMLAFSNNEDIVNDLPKRRNVMAAGIKQTSVRKPTSDLEMLQTFMEFGALS